MLYSIYSSFNCASDRQSALSNTCNTLVADVLKVLQFQNPDVLTATRDAWDLVDGGLTPLDWRDGDAAAYFQELSKEISDIEMGKTLYFQRRSQGDEIVSSHRAGTSSARSVYLEPIAEILAGLEECHVENVEGETVDKNASRGDAFE
jgi:hypothetical protein